MRSRLSAFGLLVLAGCFCCSCEERGKTEIVLEQAINQFHAQLNDEHYYDIYSQADADLRSRISEADFTAQLSTVHGQLGKTTSKAVVSIKDSFSRALGKALRPGRELVPHFDLVASDTALGDERFIWAVENDKATLVSYDFRFLCKKPCAIGFGPK